MAIAQGGEPTPRVTRHGTQSDALVFVMSNLAKAGPWTLRAIRAVLEADLNSRRADEEEGD